MRKCSNIPVATMLHIYRQELSFLSHFSGLCRTVPWSVWCMRVVSLSLTNYCSRSSLSMVRREKNARGSDVKGGKVGGRVGRLRKEESSAG